MGGGLGGAPTLLDVCSYLGMGRERERREEREGVGLGARCVVPWSPQILGGAGVLFLRRKKLAKEVERKVGTLGAV